MSKLTFTTLKNLVNQMKENNVDKDKFSFVYKVKFDVIVAIVHEGDELLVGLHTVNYGFVVKVNQNFVAELKEDDYYNLCKYLNLSFRNDGFTSNVFLKLLSSKIPDHYSGYKYSYKDMIPFLKCKPIDEAQKIYFKGWNDHTKDHNKAHNFEKTEFYFGKEVADYCRVNNISSLWTHIAKEEDTFYNPWHIK